MTFNCIFKFILMALKEKEKENKTKSSYTIYFFLLLESSTLYFSRSLSIRDSKFASI